MFIVAVNRCIVQKLHVKIQIVTKRLSADISGLVLHCQVLNEDK